MEQKHPDIELYAGYLYAFIQRFLPLSKEEFNQFLPYLEVRRYPRREEVLRYGQTDEYINLVVKGLLRKYVLVGKNEKTLQIAVEGHLIQSEVSFHTRVPSTVIIQTLEPSILVSIRYDNVQHLLDTVPLAEKIGREMMTFLFVKKDARYFAQLNHTTRQRFLHYLQHHPQIVQRVPQKILASYLEIKPETFSRLKHLLK